MNALGRPARFRSTLISPICTPAAVRVPVVRAALAARPRALLVEKPLALRPEEAQDIVRLTEAAGVRLFVNHQLRHLPPVVRLRELVTGGAIGRPLSIRAATKCSLLEQGTHLFDLISALLGDEPDFGSVLAQATGWERDPAMPDSPEHISGVVTAGGDLRIHFECGPHAPSWPGRDNPWHQAGVEVTGTAGQARWSLNRGWTLISAEGSGEELYRHEDVDDPTEALLLDGIVRATLTGTAHEADAAIALRSLDVVMAAQVSVLRGVRVEVGEALRGRDIDLLRDRLRADTASTEAQRLRTISDVAPSRVLYGLCALGVADFMVDGPRTVDELADTTGAHRETLFRLLRAATALDVVDRDDDGRWSLRPAGRLLSSTEPENLRAQFGDNDLFTSWSDFADTLRTGKCTYDEVFGAAFFDRLSATDDGRRRFHEHMFERAHALYKPLVAAQVWPEAGVLVDVCGGTGGLLVQLLEENPGLSGVLHDMPEVLDLSPLRSRPDLRPRLRFASSDVFAEVPAGGALYVLACVLHDWADDEARRILASCRAAMAPGSRLVVLERVLDETGDPGTLLSDLWMLVVTGGRERTSREWRELLGSAGFEVRDVHTAPDAELRLLECVPVGAAHG